MRFLTKTQAIVFNRVIHNKLSRVLEESKGRYKWRTCFNNCEDILFQVPRQGCDDVYRWWWIWGWWVAQWVMESIKGSMAVVVSYGIWSYELWWKTWSVISDGVIEKMDGAFHWHHWRICTYCSRIVVLPWWALLSVCSIRMFLPNIPAMLACKLSYLLVAPMCHEDIVQQSVTEQLVILNLYITQRHPYYAHDRADSPNIYLSIL